MERKLATIRKINNIEPIEGADAIEVATVDGWKVVVAKNVGHQVGDLVVYCEIDSFLPIKPEFEFLRKSSYKKLSDGTEGFRLKTIKLRGQVSQGLILPMSVFGDSSWTYYEGLEVTEKLGITKYEPPIPAELAGKIKGYFPSFIPKTDEERVQNLVKEYEEYKNLGGGFVFTEKLDGSSATFYINNGEFGVCSRNLELLETDTNTFWKVAREMDIENKLRSLNRNIALQGELIGEGIQDNRYGLKGQSVVFFNGFDIDKQERIHFLDLLNIAMDLSLSLVPFNMPQLLPSTIESILLIADQKSVLNPKVWREGIVVRHAQNPNISFKVISNKFLLEEK